MQRTAAILTDAQGVAVLEQSCHLLGNKQRAANPNAPLLRALVKLVGAGRVAVAVVPPLRSDAAPFYDVVLRVSLLDAAFSDHAPPSMHVTSDHDMKTLMLALGIDSVDLDNTILPDDAMRATLFDIMLPPLEAPVAPEPPGLLSTLFDYQRQALHWMLACETRGMAAKSDGVHCLFEAKAVPGGGLWYNRYNGMPGIVGLMTEVMIGQPRGVFCAQNCHCLVPFLVLLPVKFVVSLSVPVHYTLYNYHGPFSIVHCPLSIPSFHSIRRCGVCVPPPRCPCPLWGCAV